MSSNSLKDYLTLLLVYGIIILIMKVERIDFMLLKSIEVYKKIVKDVFDVLVEENKDWSYSLNIDSVDSYVIEKMDYNISSYCEYAVMTYKRKTVRDRKYYEVRANVISEFANDLSEFILTGNVSSHSFYLDKYEPLINRRGLAGDLIKLDVIESHKKSISEMLKDGFSLNDISVYELRELGVPSNAIRGCVSAGLRNLEDLFNKSANDLKYLNGVGTKSIVKLNDIKLELTGEPLKDLDRVNLYKSYGKRELEDEVDKYNKFISDCESKLGCSLPKLALNGNTRCLYLDDKLLCRGDASIVSSIELLMKYLEKVEKC